MLTSDIYGFLTGESVSDIKRSTALLSSIDKTLKSILGGARQGYVSPAKPLSRQSNAASRALNNDSASLVKPLSSRQGQTALKTGNSHVSNSLEPKGRARDAKGRFISNGDSTDSSIPSSPGVNGLGNKIARVIIASGEGLEDVDPSIKAFQEVAQPLARGYNNISSSHTDKKKDRWYRKIFKLLKLGKKEDTAYQKATRKSLKNIEDKPGGGSGEGDFGIKVSTIGSTIARIISKIVPLALTAITSAVGVIFSPIGLAFTGAATLAWGLFTENGQKFFSDIASSISDKWNKAVDWFMSKMPDVSGGIDKAKDAISGFFSFGSSNKKQGNSSSKSTLIKQMRADGITDPEEQAMFLAQMDHESNGFKSLEENLNYTPERLMKESSRARRIGKYSVGAAVKQGPKGVAELLYGGRKDLGNTEKGDGYRFRGRGYTQLTGRANYTQASNELGLDLVNNPDLAAQPEIAAKIATWFHKKNRRLVNASRNGDVTAARKLVNGGTNGLADVGGKYRTYLAQINSETQSTSAPIPKLPTIAKAPAVSDLPPIVTPLGGGSERKSISVTVAKGDVTQDVSDRKIAHVVTGGMSA